VSENLHRVSDRVGEACARARRDASEVMLVAVTKYVDVDMIRTLLDLGQVELGESRAQALTQRAGMIAELRARMRAGGATKMMPAPRWHMVGHLQRNKVRAVLPHVVMIHSVDSLRLSEEISRQASKRGLTLDILLEVNAGEEKAKQGLAVGAVCHLAEQVVSLPGMRLCGLMCMAPLTEDTERIRRVFVRTKELFEEIRGERFCPPEFRHLSMGMSNDYPIAVEEGATIIRVGTALFEGVAAAV
jgi:pyridoxal phosphate enzyme (YggS family)